MVTRVILCCILSLLIPVTLVNGQPNPPEVSIDSLTKGFEKKTIEEIRRNLGMIVDLHVGRYEQLTGETVPDGRKALVKDALHTGLRKALYAGLEEYREDYEAGQAIQLAKNLVNNRELIVYMLTNEEPEPVLIQRVLLYVNRKRDRPYTSPVALSVVREGGQRSEGFYMLADIGFSGSCNKVVDAGETIKLMIGLASAAERISLSTSGFLETEGKYAIIENQEAVYDEIYPEPAPAKLPDQPFTITIHPACPNGHIIWFNMLTQDTDDEGSQRPLRFGKFGLEVAKVGPLECSSAVIDDDMPGRSDPVTANGKLEEGEQIELRLKLKNLGGVDIDNVKARLLCDEDFIEVTESTHGYPVIPAQSEKGAKADYDFRVGKISNEALENGYIVMSLEITGMVNGASYYWISPFKLPVLAGQSHATTFEATEGREGKEETAELGSIPQSVLRDTESRTPYPKYITGRDGARMVLIPAGAFQMGSDDGEYDEKPLHMVYLDAFYIDVYEVTNAQYGRFIKATGRKKPRYWSDSRFCSPNQPVVGVSWHDARAYCNWAGKCLPTEAEWEKAARGGLMEEEYTWGTSGVHNCANSYHTGGIDQWEQIAPVGQFAPNGYGLCDMAGNVYEWCSDWYDESYYARSPDRNPRGPDSGEYRVIRGGSWYCNPYCLRAAYRYWGDICRRLSNDTHRYTGFRCVRNVTR